MTLHFTVVDIFSNLHKAYGKTVSSSKYWPMFFFLGGGRRRSRGVVWESEGRVWGKLWVRWEKVGGRV